jgi:glycosyltransferase involved in cell wall biosynthesis
VVNILFVHHGVGIGGAPTSLLRLVKALDKKKFQCKVVFLRDSAVVDLFRSASITVEVVNFGTPYFSHYESKKIKWYYVLKYFRIIYTWITTAYIKAPKYLKTQEFDILHLNSHALTSWSVPAKKLKKKVIIHNREAVAKGYFGFRRAILRKLILRSCDQVVNISVDNMNRLGLHGISSVIYNFIDIPPTYSYPMSVDNQTMEVLFLGGQSDLKGFDCVAKCLPLLSPGIKIVFAGHILTHENYLKKSKDSSFKAKLMRSLRNDDLLKSVYMSSNAKVVGLLANPLNHINQCDVLVTPHRNPHFSRPAIEAFAYGKPVVASNVEGMEEIVDHGVNGLLVEVNNPKSLAESLNSLLIDKKRVQEMGCEARRKAENCFSPEASMESIVDLYGKLSNNT